MSTAPTRPVRIVRILHRKYASEPFSGKGGLVAPSRWASAGQLVSYAAESLALAALETIAGAGRMGRLTDMVYVAATLNQAAIHAPPKERLPDGWNRRPPGDAARRFGDKPTRYPSAEASHTDTREGGPVQGGRAHRAGKFIEPSQRHFTETLQRWQFADAVSAVHT